MQMAIEDTFGQQKFVPYSSVDAVLSNLTKIYDKYELELLTTSVETKLAVSDPTESIHEEIKEDEEAD